MKNTIKKSTLSHDLCINCGICRYVCTSNAIEMKPNKYCENIPFIDKKKCTNCGFCTKYCPNTKEKMQEEALKIGNSENPNLFGAQEYCKYLAWNANEEERIKSASGGAITKFASYLLEAGEIDAIIHVERIAAGRKKMHYKAFISTSPEEVKTRTSSAYQPIDFSDALKEVESSKKYLITGTPCVIRGIKKLFESDSTLKKANIITCALICSHNTNSQFMDYFADKHNLPDIPYKINIRNKDNIPDANNYKNHIYTEDKDLLKMNRHQSGWTDIWRSYYFAMNCCNYCSDFWGYEADISVKDAWGKWAKDPLGKSIVLIRNNFVNDLFTKCELEIESLGIEDLKNHQIAVTDFKQKEAINKNFKPFFDKANKKNGLYKKLIISKTSKYLYNKCSAQKTEIVMKFIENLLKEKK